MNPPESNFNFLQRDFKFNKPFIMSSKTSIEKQNAAIRDHEYSMVNQSLIEPYLEIYWTWLSKKLPNHWAPNALTLAGVLINIVAGCTILIYTQDAMQEAPRWVYLLCAVCVFAYQTIDSLDGHQARRMGVDGPFDEFFDHGCDAFSSGLITLGSMAAVKMGQYPMLLLAHQCTVGVCFYMSHYQAYVTGTLHFGLFDAVEAQWLAIFIHLTCAIMSPDVFDMTVPCLNVSGRYLGCILSLLAFYLYILRRFGVILQYWGRHKTTVNGHSALLPAVSIISLVCLETLLATHTTLYSTNKCLFLIGFGILLARLVNFLVVNIISGESVPAVDTWVIGPLVLCASPLLNPFISEFNLLVLVLVFNAVDFVKYFAQTCLQYEEALDMYTFCITSRPSSKLNGKHGTNGKHGSQEKIRTSGIHGKTD